MPKILITGGAGFIGSHIAMAALKGGFEVKIIDNLYTGCLENLSGIKDRIEFIKGDIMDLGLLKNEFHDADFVSHQAALRSVPASFDSPAEYNRVNINGTLNVLEAARHCGVNRVVFASSSSVYGNSESLPERETDRPKPISPYAITKLACEMYMKSYNQTYGLETVNLRYFNVFGPMQDPNSRYATVIPLIIRDAINGKTVTVFGDGSQSRDFTYVKDVSEANVLTCKSKKSSGKTFNIACGKNISINDIIQKTAIILGKQIKTKHIHDRKGDVKHSLADITKSREILGYEPKYDFDTGLRETVKWFRETHA